MHLREDWEFSTKYVDSITRQNKMTVAAPLIAVASNQKNISAQLAAASVCLFFCNRNSAFLRLDGPRIRRLGQSPLDTVSYEFRLSVQILTPHF